MHGHDQRHDETHMELRAGEQFGQGEAIVEHRRLRESGPGFAHRAVQGGANHQERR